MTLIREGAANSMVGQRREFKETEIAERTARCMAGASSGAALANQMMSARGIAFAIDSGRLEVAVTDVHGGGRVRNGRGNIVRVWAGGGEEVVGGVVGCEWACAA